MGIGELRIVQLSILDYVDDICKKNQLTYYLFAGTMLGAIRHKGFIPWDHDIDVALPRPDYEKLISLIETDNLSSFFISTYRNNRKHASPHAILYARNKRIINRHPISNAEIYYGGIKFAYIDIFPLDKGPNDLSKQRMQSHNLHKLKTILYFKHSPLLRKSFLYRLAKKAIQVIFSPLSYRTLNRIIDKELTKYNDCESDYIFDGATSYSYFHTILPKRVFSDVIFVDFEQKKYPIPAGYEEYLRKYYGDYMKLPDQKDIDRDMSSFPTLIE